MTIEEIKKGMTITHDVFGNGRVLSVNNIFGYVVVEFDKETKGKTKRMMFPGSLKLIEEVVFEYAKPEQIELKENKEPEKETIVFPQKEAKEEIDAGTGIGQSEETSNQEEPFITPIILNRVSSNEIKDKIIQLVSQENWNYGSPTISSVLLGVRTKANASRNLDSNPLFGTFANENVTEMDINICIDELLYDKPSKILRDRESGIVTIKKEFKKQTVAFRPEPHSKTVDDDKKFVDDLRKGNPQLLQWFDEISKTVNPESIRISAKSYYGYVAKKGKYWIAKGKTDNSFVFRYRYGENGDVLTVSLNEETKSRVSHLIMVLNQGQSSTIEKQRIAKEMKKLESLIHYKFNDKYLLEKAMCSSIIEVFCEGKVTKEHSNEGMATVGDTVLKLVIADYLYSEKGVKTKGEITDRKSELERNTTLHEVMVKEGLIDYAYNDHHFYSDRDIPSHEQVVSGEHDAYLEAIVGAMYYDAGFNKTKEWIRKWLIPLLDKYKKTTN